MENLPEPQNSQLSHIYAFLGITTILIAALFWLFSVNATAERAEAQSQQNAQAIEKKADREATQEQLKRIFDKLDSIDTYLRGKR